MPFDVKLHTMKDGIFAQNYTKDGWHTCKIYVLSCFASSNYSIVPQMNIFAAGKLAIHYLAIQLVLPQKLINTQNYFRICWMEMKRVIYAEDTSITLTCSEIHRDLETSWTSTRIVAMSVCTQILVGTEVGSSTGTFIDICINICKWKFS